MEAARRTDLAHELAVSAMRMRQNASDLRAEAEAAGDAKGIRKADSLLRQVEKMIKQSGLDRYATRT